MAFATKYTVRKLDSETKTMWRAHFQLDGASFVGELPPGIRTISINYRANTQDPEWLYAPSVATIEFVDTEEGLLTELFGKNDTDYRLVITEDINNDGNEVLFWMGFIDSDSYVTKLYGKTISRFQATDNLRALDNIAFDDDGTPYEGQARIVDMLARALEKTGLEIGLQTAAYRYSYLETNPLNDSLDPLYYHSWDQRVYQTSDGEPYTCMDVLKDICEGWLQVFQSGGRWCIYERKRDVQAVPPHIFTVWNYDANGTPETLSTQNAKIDVSTTANSRHKFVKHADYTADRPISQASIIYQHGRLESLFKNLDFELPLSGNWNPTTNVELSNDALEGSYSANLKGHFELEPRINGLVESIEQVAPVGVDAATGYTFRLNFNLKMPNYNDLPVGNQAYWYFLHEVQGDKYYRWSDSTWQDVGSLTDAQKANEVPISQFIMNNSWGFQLQINTPVLDGLSGIPRLKMWNVVEVDPGSGTLSQSSFLIDNISFELLDPTGQVIRLAQRTTASINNSPNTTKLGDKLILHGTGPINTFYGAIRQRDSTDTDVGLASSWAVGIPVSENGHTFERVAADEYVRQYRDAPRVVKGTIMVTKALAANALRPHNQILVERSEDTTQDDYAWFQDLTFNPTNPREYMVGSWIAVNNGIDPDNHAVTNIDDADDIQGIRSFTSVVSLSSSVNSNISVIDSKGGLEAESVGEEESAAVLSSVVTNLEKGAGWFIGDPADSLTPLDDGTILADPAGLRWKRMFTDGPWRTEWFGAVWDGVQDDSAAIQKCVNAAPSGTTILLPSACAVVDTQIIIDGKNLHFKGEAPSWYKDDGRTGFPSTPGGTLIKSGDTITAALFRVEDTQTAGGQYSQVVFENIHFLGNIDGTATGTHAVEFVEAYRAGMIRCHVNKFTLAGVESINPDEILDATPSEELFFEDCTFAENGQNGLFLQANNSRVRNCSFENNGANGFAETLFCVSGNIVENCRSIGNADAGFVFASANGDTQVRNNLAQNNGATGFNMEGPLATAFKYSVTGNSSIGNGTDTGLSDEQRSGFRIRAIQEISFTGNLASDNQGYGLFLADNYKGTFSDLAGLNNVAGLVNTEIQALGPVGTYNAVHEGMLQKSNDGSLPFTELLNRVDPGSTIVMPNGQYQLESQVIIFDPINLAGYAIGDRSGANGGTRIKVGSSIDAPMIDTSFTTNGIVVENINFIGIGSSSPGTDVSAFRLLANNATFRNCGFYNFNGFGLELGGSDNLVLQNCVFEDNNLAGITMAGDNVIIQNCIFKNTTQTGLQITGGSRAIIEGCQFTGNNIGILLNGSDQTTIRNCIFGDNLAAGIRILAGDRISVLGCTFDANENGLELQGGTNICVQGNDVSGSNSYGIVTTADLESATIINNTGAGNSLGLFDLNSASAGDLAIDLEFISTLDFASIASGGVGTQVITVFGARIYDTVRLGPPPALEAGLMAMGVVTADDTLEIRLFNSSASPVNPASGDWSVHVSRRSPAPSLPAPDPEELTLIVDIDVDNRNLLRYG